MFVSTIDNSKITLACSAYKDFLDNRRYTLFQKKCNPEHFVLNGACRACASLISYVVYLRAHGWRGFVTAEHAFVCLGGEMRDTI